MEAGSNTPTSSKKKVVQNAEDEVCEKVERKPEAQKVKTTEERGRRDKG